MLPGSARITAQKRHMPDPGLRHVIESATRAQSCRCWTCGSCDIECPVNIATGRLRPQRIVRLANLGFIEELLDSPEIWYCLTCRRCLQICPNQVKPCDVIDYARQEAVSRGIVSSSSTRRLKLLFARFQRVRWRAVEQCLNNNFNAISREQIDPVARRSRSGNRPNDFTPRHSSGRVFFRRLRCCNPFRRLLHLRRVQQRLSGIRREKRFRSTVHCSHGEPRACRGIVRSPSIWLCLSCGRCSDACGQHGRRPPDSAAPSGWPPSWMPW